MYPYCKMVGRGGGGGRNPVFSGKAHYLRDLINVQGGLRKAAVKLPWTLEPDKSGT